MAPAFLHLLRDVPYVRTDIDDPKESSCQKLLFSATLTRDPAKISALGLRQAKYIVVQSPKTKTTDVGSERKLEDELGARPTQS